jgi:HK97 family phage major capsid protein
MANRLTEIRARLAELQPEIARLSTIEDITPEDDASLTEHLREFGELQTEEQPLVVREEAVRSALDATVVRSDGDGAAGVEAARASFNTIVRPSNDDVYDLRSLRDISEDRHAGELRDRALRAIEHGPHMSDAHKETAVAHVDRGDLRGDKARWILEHGSPAYHEAFQDYLRHPHAGPTQGRADRAAMSLTGANGGFLVPFTLDPTIILTNDGSIDPFRAISTVKTITTDDWNGVTSAGVTAEWIAEATEVADASPTFAQPSIPVFKADAYIQGSMEVVADSGVSGDIAMLIADAKANLEATAHATGNGTTQPQGVVTALQLVTASRVAGTSGAAGAADFVVGDIYAVDNDMGSRFRPGASWVGNKAILNRIRRFGEGSNGSNAAFWTDLGRGLPPELIGYPVYQSSAMDSTIVSGSNDDILILGDFRYGNYIIDRMGLELQFNPMVLGSNRRPTGEVAWVAFWRTGGEVVAPQAFRMLRV